MDSLRPREDKPAPLISRSARLEISHLSESDLAALKLELEKSFGQELRKVTRLRLFYLGLSALALSLFAVLLFFSAKSHQDITLWGIGLCLLIFSLIQFLEMDDATTENSLLEILFRRHHQSPSGSPRKP